MNKWKLVCFFLLLLVALFDMDAVAVNNPVSYDGEIHDCDVIKYNGEYYITGNSLAGDMLRSRDLESWGERKHIFSWNNSWHTAHNTAEPNRDIHAGHIRYINGIFHLYTQLDNDPDGAEIPSITHATASNPWGPYIESVDSPFADHIDAETFLDDDGQLYFYSTRFPGTGNHNFVRKMSDPWTFNGIYTDQVSANLGWEQSDIYLVNEGPKVMKYRGRYYMLYAANHTEDPNYAIGCVEAGGPMAFSNAGKYNDAICTKTTPKAGKPEIAYIGQPWVVDGLNGFEKWMGYFAQVAGDGRTQRIDRMHFFDRHLFVDGPTDRWTPGYHPSPAKPQLLNIFPISDGPMLPEDWMELTPGSWAVANEEAIQSDQAAWALNTVNRDASENYLIEANLKFTQAQDSEDKAGVLAYYQDVDNFVLVGFNRVMDDWYMHVREGGVDDIQGGSYGGSVNYEAYHKIRVTKNGGVFDVRIDDMIPPGFTPAVTGLGVGLPGVYTDHAVVAFDGIVYTIGWDEYDSGITGWGDNVGGFAETGAWATGSTGITMTDGTGYIFKGDLMQEFEISAQVYKEGATDGSMGLALAVDTSNYLIARIDLAMDQLILEGAEGGLGIGAPAVSVANKSDYNIRIVKLSGRVIVFVDGVEKQSITVGYGPAQAGLYVKEMSARFNGIMAYRTEPDVAPDSWVMTDVGSPGFPGTADLSDQALYMTGSGADIWHLSDEFAFAQKEVSGDWEFVTRVVANDRTHYFSKAGLMFRDSMAQNSPMVHLSATPRDYGYGGVHLHWRDIAGGGTGYADVLDVQYPIWIKLNRTGTTFTGSYSLDGQNWDLVGSHISPVNTTGKLGFSLCSVGNDRIARAVFDRFSLKRLAYESWIGGYALSGTDVLRTADPDGDGVANFAEYALDGIPNVHDAATILPTFGIVDVGDGSNVMDYIYTRRLNATALGLTYGLNMNNDLMDAWANVGTAYETGTSGIDLSFESVSNSVPFAGDSGFVELMITED